MSNPTNKQLTLTDLENCIKHLDELKRSDRLSAEQRLIDFMNEYNYPQIAERIKKEGLPQMIFANAVMVDTLKLAFGSWIDIVSSNSLPPGRIMFSWVNTSIDKIWVEYNQPLL